jgi:RNA polymerase sigma factor (sigma-70 family)
VTYPGSGPVPAAPAELVTLLAADTDSALDEAWGAFVHAFTAPILRTARSLGGDADAAMDRYAFVLDRLRDDECRRLRAYVRPDAGEFALWLTVVVRRLCLDHYRERYGRPRRPAGADIGAADPERAGRRRLVDLVADRTDPTLLASPTQVSPDELLVRSERLQALSGALDQLSPSDRLMLRLRFAEDLPAREIARLMRFPTLFHVYRRLDKVLRQLRETLSRLGIEDES